MADDAVIRAERLGKKYIIGHEAERERYVALRDVIARAARGAWRRTKDMARGRAIVSGDSVEEFWALKDVSFEVKRGEVLGIIGRNGAGKSTLLKILSRITEPSEGRVTIKGRVASLLEVGTGFHPELTGRENIYLNGAILGMTRAEIKRKFDEIVAFAEVERFLDTPVKRFSSGMYVRLAFAVAAHLEPEILIIDEVLAVGDFEFQKKCLGKMSEVSNRGRTVLFVSHNMAAVGRLCTRGLLLSGGCVAACGDAEAVVGEYASDVQPSYSITFPENGTRPSITEIQVDQQAIVAHDLVVDISFTSPWPIQNPIGGIVLRTRAGEPVWGSNSRFHPSAGQAKAQVRGVLRCEARGLPVVDGDYLLSVWLGDWHQDHGSKLDVLGIRIGNDYADPHRPPAVATGHLDWPAVWTSHAAPTDSELTSRGAAVQLASHFSFDGDG
jgi:lipopolysaccharide transport system ATP-binding protein